MTSKSVVGSLASAFCLFFSFVATGFAATNPLQSPWGLAVDSKGYLYVANFDGNNIVVFGPGYTQQTARTITTGISGPTGLALDSFGNLWVANSQANGDVGNVTQYLNGSQQIGATITNGLNAPTALAIDGSDTVYVVNDFSTLTVYAETVPFTPPTTLITTQNLVTPTYGVAVANGTLSYGSTSTTTFLPNTCFLLNNCAEQKGFPEGGFALASDSQGNVYAGGFDNKISVNSPKFGGSYNLGLIQLSFIPYGIAVDNARGRLYISDFADNKIWVYSTKGTFIRTLE